MEKIICKNCGKTSFNDYYDFCSVWCFVDFAHKNQMHMDKVRAMSHQIRETYLYKEIEKLEDEVYDVESRNDDAVSDLAEMEGNISSLTFAREYIENYLEDCFEDKDVLTKDRAKEIVEKSREYGRID